MSTLIYLLLAIPAMLLAFTFHEMCHAWAASALGDPTAQRAGRMTLDPRQHLDPMGTAMLLLSFVLTGGHGPVFGYAKPVQFNPYNLRDPRRDGGLIALAGPLSNFVLAMVSGFLMVHVPFPEIVRAFLYISVLTNVGLGLFNMIPVAPLDGAKVLKAVLPQEAAYRMDRFEQRHGAMLPLVALVAFMTVLSGPFSYVFQSVVNLIV